jgi:chromate reductase, NAD(P)H dehydrogenase (quinone)
MITIITSTNRKNSASQKVALHICEQLKVKNTKFNYLSLEDLPHDFIFSNFNGNVNKDFQQIIDTKIIPATKFIFVVPEYNGAFPGVLKAFVDCIAPKNFHNKQAALVGVADGHAGALRALDMLTLVLNHIRVNVHWNKPKLSDIGNNFEGDKLNELYSRRVETMLNDFV